MRKWIFILLNFYAAGLVIVLDGMLYVGDSISWREIRMGIPLVCCALANLWLMGSRRNLTKLLSIIPFSYFVYAANSIGQPVTGPGLATSEKFKVLVVCLPFIALGLLPWIPVKPKPASPD